MSDYSDLKSAYYRRNSGTKLWLAKSKRGAWIFQYRPTIDEVKRICGYHPDYPFDGNGSIIDDDAKKRYPPSNIEVYTIKVVEVERKKLFTTKG